MKTCECLCQEHTHTCHRVLWNDPPLDRLEEAGLWIVEVMFPHSKRLNHTERRDFHIVTECVDRTLDNKTEGVFTCRGMYFPFSLRMRLRSSTWLDTNTNNTSLSVVGSIKPFIQNNNNNNNSSSSVGFHRTKAAQQQDASDSPVGHLLQVHLFVAVQQLSHIVTDDPDEESDEDNGQDHPQSNTGVQQELWTGHRSLFNQPEVETGRTSGGAAESMWDRTIELDHLDHITSAPTTDLKYNYLSPLIKSLLQLTNNTCKENCY